ncbi:hypothetical protein MMC09_006557 [Bachmanniomyces sp. S44760]|nr:hypothetical protein [Bachmanniomyces sp. S44760]
MSYNPFYGASKPLPVERIVEQLNDFAASGQDLSRRRFSKSPPRVSSVPSTTYEESQPPSPGELLRDRQRIELRNSDADEQFGIQMEDELDRIRAARDKGLLQDSFIPEWDEAAEANVIYRWMRQGIWDDRWENMPGGKIWRHEMQDIPQSLRPSKPAKRKHRETELQRVLAEFREVYKETVRSAIEFQKTQWSRPCYQFVHQFCEERQWIKMGLCGQDQDEQANLDERAYKNVRSRWVRDGVWDDSWISMPGVSWRHELPQKESLGENEAWKAAKLAKTERTPDWYFMAPIEPLEMGNRETRRASPVERPSNSFAPTISEPDQFVTSEPLGSPHQLTAEDKPLTVGQERDECPIKSYTNVSTANTTRKTKAKGVPSRKQKGHTPQPLTSETRARNKRVSAKAATCHQASQEAKTLVRNNAASSRPRRVAAMKAMENLTRTPRR